MALSDQIERKPSAVQGAMRVRNMVRQAAGTLEGSLNGICEIMERFERSNVDQELGDDAQELNTAFAAMKECLTKLNPSAEVRELPQ